MRYHSRYTLQPKLGSGDVQARGWYWLRVDNKIHIAEIQTADTDSNNNVDDSVLTAVRIIRWGSVGLVVLTAG